ncbi:hypothetical protein Pint_25639 [Pistacia integerrima]|uniref:Uncharacterized protein n=1 Tax=Pistacia integerrima TaxID=434235 RepID=A0ACC0YD10_9ROSI|nr:hypothetical protein Pint_25639 [Pistacia integerrima]
MKMYVKCGRLDEARLVFNGMGESSIISWAIIIGGFVNVVKVGEAFGVFNQMRRTSLKPNLIVFLKLISGCSQEGNLLLASLVHSLVLKCGSKDEDPIDNLLVSMYIRCGDLESSQRVFDMVQEKNVFLWTSMIGGYAQLAYPTEALNLFKRLLKTFVRPNEATMAIILSACADLGSRAMGEEIEEYILVNGLESSRQVLTSLIHMFSKCGSIKKAKEVFKRVSDKDLAVWGALINGYAIHGMGDEAFSLFHKMQQVEGIKPNDVVYTSLLSVCSHSGLVEDGLRYFRSM